MFEKVAEGPGKWQMPPTKNHPKTSQENIRAHLYKIWEVLNQVQKHFQKGKNVNKVDTVKQQ